MDKKRRSRRAVELGKDVLIVLLACSALFLASRTQMLGPMRGLWKDEEAQVSASQNQTEERVSAARPLRLAVRLPGGGRYGVQYDEEASDALFQQVASLLVETMSGAGVPEEINRDQWQDALARHTSVYFDFQGELPFSVLAGWLSGEESGLATMVRRLALSVWQESVALYYQDERDGRYYRCISEVVDAGRLEESLAGLTGNGAFFAFEESQYAMLAPDTLLRSDIADVKVYAATTPISGDQATLETLAEELGFFINPNGVYYAGEWVARSGNDTLRLSDQGVATYLAEEGGDGHFSVAGQTLFDAVERCRQLAAATLGTRCGQARLYLMSAVETEQGWLIDFGYSLNGIPVQLETGYAARFQVENGYVAQFELRCRSYTDSGAVSAVLPVRQAAAALEAMGLEGEELLLVYRDRGGDTLTAGWEAADWKAGKG